MHEQRPPYLSPCTACTNLIPGLYAANTNTVGSLSQAVAWLLGWLFNSSWAVTAPVCLGNPLPNAFLERGTAWSGGEARREERQGAAAMQGLTQP